jgi:hypothetical protein
MYKRIFLLLLLTILVQLKPEKIFCQSIQVNVVVSPPYPVNLEEALKLNRQTIITITNLSNEPKQIKLLATVEGDNGISARIQPGFVPTSPIILQPRETRSLNGSQLKNINSNLTENDVDLQGMNVNRIIQTETLPEGNYELCIRAFSYLGSTPLSNEFTGCTNIFLTHYDPPIIIHPFDGSTQTAKIPQFLQFNWTPSGIPGITRYSLDIVDMDFNNLNNPNDAFDNPAVFAFLRKDNLINPIFNVSNLEPQLLVGRTYAARVRAYDPTAQIAFKNEGKGPVISFKYLPNQLILPDKNVNNNNGPGYNPNIKNNENPVQFALNICEEPVNIPNNVPINGNGKFGNLDEINLGGHTLLLTNVTWNGKNLSGQGKITDTWFRIPILVEFENLQLNSDGQVIEGFAKARNDENLPSQWINDLGNIQFGEEQIKIAIQKLLGNSQQRIYDFKDKAKNIGVGMPVGINRNIGGANQLIGIVGMHFGVGGCALNAIAQINIPSKNQKLSLAASGVCFDNQGFTKDGLLYLAEDYTINPNGNIKMNLLKADQENADQGTFIKMENTGFKFLRLDGSLEIASTVVHPVDPNENKVTAPFSMEVENFHNFMLDDLSFQPFEFNRLPGFTVNIQSLSYDHSEVSNPQNLQFPVPNYNQEGNLWQGFHLKTVDLTLPEQLHKDFKIQASNLIIDDFGFTGLLDIPMVLGTNQGKMGSRNWPFSIENFFIKVVKNQWEEGSFNGKIRVPIQKENDFLQYQALISLLDDELDYQFSVETQEEIEFPAIIAKGKILPNTSIIIEKSGNGFDPRMHLFAKLDLNTPLNINIQSFPLSFSGVEVQDLIIDKNGYHFGPDGAFSYSYGEDQRKVFGFNVTLDTFTIVKPNQLFAGMDMQLIGESNVVGGRVRVFINTKWENDLLKLESMKLSDLYINGDVSIAHVEGYLKRYDNDNVYGDGFAGGLDVGINLGETNALPIAAEMNLLFGRKDDYKYFYIDGAVDGLPNIPLSASMRFYGFKGGIYYKMKRESIDVLPVPDKSIKFGLLAGAAIGLDSKRAFHSKLVLEANFTTSGLGQIYFDGDAYMFTDYQPGWEPYDPSTTPIQIAATAKMDFTTKVFDFDGSVTAKYPTTGNPLVKGNGAVKIHVGGNKDWYIKIGEPGPEENITLELADIITKKHYLMAGYGLPSMPPLPEPIMSKLAENNIQPASQRTNLTSEKNLRYAFGSNYHFNTGELNYWILYGSFAADLGYDISISDGWGDCGFRGWYVNGQAYGRVDAGIGLKAKLFGKERKFKIAELSVGAALEVALPNKFYINGMVYGEATFLGIIEGSFDFQVEKGQKCQQKPQYEEENALENLKYIQDTNPKNGKTGVSVMAVPQVVMLFSTNDNKTYPLTELNEYGVEINREFRFPIHKLQIIVDDPNSSKNGEIIANLDSKSYQGYFKKNSKGDVFTYQSEKALEPHTWYKWIIEIRVLEKINGVWNTVAANDTKVEIRFKTGAGPKTIENANVAFCYPDRAQNFYLQNENGRRGFVKVKVDAYSNIFNLNGNQFEKDSILIRFIPVGGGSVQKGTFLGYSGNKVMFSHPPLLNNKMYVIQIVKKHANWLTNTPDDDPEIYLSAGQNFEDNLTKGQKLLGDLQTSKKEYEIYKYVFKTSRYNTLESKIASLQSGKVMAMGNPPFSGRTIEVIGQNEGFDKFDNQQIDFNWFLTESFGGSGSGGNGQTILNKPKPNFYWNSYLNPKVYNGYNEILVPGAYPWISKIDPSTYVEVINPVPPISQELINKILNEKVNPGMVFQAPPSPQKILFQLYGESIGFYTYKNYLIPRLFNVNNPEIKKCIQYTPGYNKDLRTLMDYHIDNPNFKTLTGGSYQFLASSKLVGNHQYLIDWKKEFGIQNN